MISSENLVLSDIIDLQTLSNIQEKLAKLVNFSVVTTDVNGKPIINWSNFSPFCKLIRSSRKGAEQCISCDYEHGKIARAKKQAIFYDCHLGLKDCAAPIFVNDLYVGAVLGGQVMLKGEQSREAIDVEKIASDYDLPIAAIKAVVEKIPLASREYLEDCIDFYTFLANYIAQLGMNRITQEQLLKESREKLQLEKKAKKMELKKIQAQINPHFLFNTLNSIARMSLIEDAPQTEELIYNLADFLRYNLKNTEEFPKIRDEIENIKRYLYIQALRYSDRISCQFDIDESIMDYRIPSMTLQPIVENAMVHGLEMKKGEGLLKLSGRRHEHHLEIRVWDNGVGIKPAVLNLINHLNKTPNESLGIGLLNTHNRIKYYFGAEYGLKIESTPNVETNVSICIPCIRENPND
ncbi:PocR ligand-binding domain-containing protein [Bacillaceae bacterium Marseille-Q3522]|nr:PocR ligand-binding domain-containing protein [Bacillaceae bacterium Marseille-Q3522]